jgi:D-3-phosphoglycerate dehydrogenase / 2-oxoglutarate reductase
LKDIFGMSRVTIAVADPIHPAGVSSLRERYDVAVLPEMEDETERAQAIAKASAIVVRLFKVGNSVLDRAPHLKLVAKHGSGVDNIDIPAATQYGVLVANTPGGANATSVAEGAVALMLAVLRRIRDMDACVRDGRFNDRWSINLHELWGKKVGLVGFGQIARVTARICGAGFNAAVMCYDPFVSAGEMAALGVEKVDDLAQLAARSDIFSIHAPLSKATRHIVNADVLSAMPAHAILINTSRGGVVDEKALIAVLRQRRIAGAGIDVFEEEPPALDNPLFKLDNVVLSPHVAGVTDESLKGMAMLVVELIDNVFSGRRPHTLLNGSIWESWKP